MSDKGPGSQEFPRIKKPSGESSPTYGARVPEMPNLALQRFRGFGRVP
jgi:hypothetical protein